MRRDLSAWQLGATLYTPATYDKSELLRLMMGKKNPSLRSLVICLEDAVSDQDVEVALQQLKETLDELRDVPADSARPLLFVRPRHALMARTIRETMAIDQIDGLVLPKFTEETLGSWWPAIQNTSLYIMPTLETFDVYDVNKMHSLAAALNQHPIKNHILALRIGGNDLMSVLSLRRSPRLTLYDGPLGYVIKMLVSVFSPLGFSLTAPVCEHIDNLDILAREVELDVAHGLIGKTAIHPSQIELIHNAFKVTQSEYTDATSINKTDKAVYKSQGAMCEPATHRKWACSIITRAQSYGLITI